MHRARADRRHGVRRRGVAAPAETQNGVKMSHPPISRLIFTPFVFHRDRAAAGAGRLGDASV
jgi:hypothetical protein